jgi:hypothetical protein
MSLDHVNININLNTLYLKLQILLKKLRFRERERERGKRAMQVGRLSYLVWLVEGGGFMSFDSIIIK